MIDLPQAEYVCYVAGKSGGHIVPALTLAHQGKEQNPRQRNLFISNDSLLDKAIIERDAVVDRHVSMKLSSVARWYKIPIVVCQLIWSGIKSCSLFIMDRPKKVISTGGLISIPVVCVAWALRIPVTLYELNAVPGKAILFLRRFATRINVCFKEAISFFDASKTFLVEYPIRFTYAPKKDSARKALGYSDDARVVLVLGGSQGSHFINIFARAYAHACFEKRPQQELIFIHQSGANDVAALASFYQSLGMRAEVFAYRSDLALYYAAADIAIARAGAGTLFELAYFDLKSLIIPLETKTTDHQCENARAFFKQRPDLIKIVDQKIVEKNMSVGLVALDQLLAS